MKYGKLTFEPITDSSTAISSSVRAVLVGDIAKQAYVADIDPSLSDTAVFCERYDIPLSMCANCVVVEAKRGDRTWYSACLVLATTRADINGTIRRALGARRASFAPMEQAVNMTGMEYGGISPLGLPEDWHCIVDAQVYESPYIIIGSGVRHSKLLVPGTIVRSLPNIAIFDCIQHAAETA